jgi:hypothetical protein
MEKQILEVVVQRLDRLEQAVVEVNLQLASLVDVLVSNPMQDCKTGEEVMAYYGRNKKQNVQIVRNMFEKMGISGEPIPAEELQARMARQGIRAEDNEFSRAIIEEREK